MSSAKPGSLIILHIISAFVVLNVIISTYSCAESHLWLLILYIMGFISLGFNTVNYEDSLSFLPIVSQRSIHVDTGPPIRSTLS